MKYELEAKAVYEQIQNYMCETPAWTFIAEALASAEKKGREEGKKLQHALDLATYGSATMELPPTEAFKDGWNEAITAAKKVAEEYDNYDTYPFCNCPSVIASKIEALRKG